MNNSRQVRARRDKGDELRARVVAKGEVEDVGCTQNFRNFPTMAINGSVLGCHSRREACGIF